MNFIHTVPLALSKFLSKWLKVNKWDYFCFRSQIFFFSLANQFLLINYDLKIHSVQMDCLLVIHSFKFKQCENESDGL